MANSYTFNQIATILNQITADSQGRTANIATTPRDTSEFVTMARTALAAGTDPIMNSITQMINRTIFAYRPYTRKFKILEADNLTWGNIVRKLTPVFTDGADDAPLYNDQPLDGNSTDQWKIKRPKTVETVFTGAEVYQIQAPTVFVDQLNSAFRGPEELSAFIAAQVGEVSNEIEQQAEALARMTAVNFAAAKIHTGNGVVHLLTEYKAATGLSELSDTTVMQPEKFPAFIKWVYARIAAVSDQMTERSNAYHTTLTGKNILRHTPKEYQRLLMFSPAMHQIKSMVLADTFHDDFLKLTPYEAVNFWQNLNQPQQINVTASYLDVDGSVKTATVAKDKLFAILYDRDAMGTNVMSEGALVTPVNAKGKYYNTFHSMTKRYWNDTTENGVVFLLD